MDLSLKEELTKPRPCQHKRTTGFSGYDDRPWGECLDCGLIDRWDRLFPEKLKKEQS